MNVFERIVQKYGQEVRVVRPGMDPVLVKAFLQPVTGKTESGPDMTALGGVLPWRYLYLGPAEMDLEHLEPGYLEFNGRALFALRAERVYCGESALYFWAILTPGVPDPGPG